MPKVPDFPSATRLSTGDYYYVVTTGGDSRKIIMGDADASPNQHKIVSLKSINHLKNFNTANIPDGSTVHIKSYYEDYSDKGLGGGHFIWRSTSNATEDSGRYIRPSTNLSIGRWERTLKGEIPNVMMWGAKGDAYTYDDPINKHVRLTTFGNINAIPHNDTWAIRNALLACRFQWAGILRFPNSYYKVTDTLYWDPTQTKLIGEGTANNSIIYMDTGIQKDILVSITASGIMSHNANPSLSTQPNSAGGHPHDLVRIESLAIGYVGASYAEPYGHSGWSPWVNTTDSVLVISQAGETNGIYNSQFFGGKYGIRTIGPGAPGPRLHDVTFVNAGTACIGLHPFVYKSWNDSEWVWATGGGGGLWSINSSADYRGTNITGFSFVEVPDGGYPNIYLNSTKLEGEFRGGIVNYNANFNFNSYLSSINIENLYWNVTQTHKGFEDQTVVVITGSPSAKNTIKTRLCNLRLYNVTNLIKDYILRNDDGSPYILNPEYYGYGQSYNQQMCIPEIYHYGRRRDITVNGETFGSLSFVHDKYEDRLETRFYPTQTGWYRIAVGMGPYSNCFNHEFYISAPDGFRRINTKASSEFFYPQHHIESEYMPQKPNLFGDNVPMITRARLYRTNQSFSGAFLSPFSAYLDIYINRLHLNNETTNSGQKFIRISAQMNGLKGGLPLNSDELLVNPFLTTGIRHTYNPIDSPYAEVDLTRPHDIHQYDGRFYGRQFATTLLDKDLHLFVNSSRQVRLFDAGTTVTFSGGGATTQATGIPIISDGKLKQIVISSSGAGYTSFPFIHIRPNTANNGTGAFASGTIVGGYVSRVTIISGGDLYGRGPNSNTAGVSITTGT